MRELPDDMDDNIRKRLQNYSEDPDADLFEKINGVIQNNASIKERLSNFKDEVDEVVWSNVQSQLIINDFVRWLDWSGQVFAALSFLFLGIAITSGDVKQQDQSVRYALSKPTEEFTQNEEVLQNDQEKTALDETSVQTGKTRLSENENLKKAVDRGNSESKESKIKLPEKQKDIALADEEIAIETLQPVNDPISKSDSAHLHKSFSLSNSQEEVSETDSLNVKLKQSNGEAVMKTETKKEKQQRNFLKPKGLYVLVMPTFGYQQISPVNHDNILIESIQKISAFSTKRLGIRSEIGVERELSKRLIANAGILYFQRKQTIAYNFKTTEDFTVDPLQGDSLLYQVNLRPQSGTFDYDLKNVGLVVGMSYSYSVKQFSQHFGIGAEVHRSLKKRSIEFPERPTYVFGNVYYRISYPISSRFDLTFQPTLNYAIKIHEQIDAPFYVKPYGVGLNFGAYYHF